LPVEYETYAFDLEFANKNDKSKWDLRYNYTGTFDLEDLSPASFMKYANKMLHNEEMARLWRNHRHIDHLKPKEECD